MNHYKYLKALEELNLSTIEVDRFSKIHKQAHLFHRIKKKWAMFVIKRKYTKKTYSENKIRDEWLKDIYVPDYNPKIVVYTCITGNYDSILDPYIVSDNIDYIAFSDKNINSTIWKQRNLPEATSNISDFSKINRYIKMHPHDLFKNEYDYSIYIDGNVKVISNVTSLTTYADNEYGFCMHEHVSRNDVYDEGKVCLLFNKGVKKNIKKQLEKYANEGLPVDFGLLEATIIVSNLKNDDANIFFEKWWEEYLRSESNRDQLSLPYILWKSNIPIDRVNKLGKNVYRNPKFKIYSH